MQNQAVVVHSEFFCTWKIVYPGDGLGVILSTGRYDWDIFVGLSNGYAAWKVWLSHSVTPLEEWKMMIKTILWRRVDQPGHESARLWFDELGGNLSGTAVFLNDKQPCQLEYHVECSANWRTKSVTVGGWVGAQEVDIELLVDSANRWWINGIECPSVYGCIDIDLNFSPATNLLPIRRLNLAVGQKAKVKAAWLRFPSFAIEPLDQLISRIESSTYRYESGSLKTNLLVNEAGFVISYPDYWELEAIS